MPQSDRKDWDQMVKIAEARRAARRLIELMEK